MYRALSNLSVKSNPVYQVLRVPVQVTLSGVNIELEPGVTLTVNGELLMPDDATIRVNPNAKVIINGGRIDNACDGMWRGIEVLGNPNQLQFDNYQGKVVMSNGGTIENATLGVSLGIPNENGTPDLSTTGGFITCATGAKFINCTRAVRAYDYAGAFNNRTKFHNTTFEINDELLDGSDPSYQVQMRGVNGVLFNNCTFTNTRLDDFPIQDAGKGIAASYSGFKVTNCNFENLELGIGVKSLGFDDIKISENTFTGNLGGVSLRYSGLAEVLENTFNIPVPADLTFPDGVVIKIPYGLYLAAGTGYEVEENQFFSSEDAKNVGIVVHNTGDLYNDIYKNDFWHLGAGIIAMGDNRGPEIDEGLEFLCNRLGTEEEPLNYSIALTNEGEVQHYQGVLGVDDGGAGNVFLPLCPPFTTDKEFYVSDDTPLSSSVIYVPFAEDETRPDCNTTTMVGVPLSDDPFDYEAHCPSNQSSGGVLGDHVGKYQLNQGILSGLYDVYDNTVNGGDTKFLLDLIDDPFVSSFDLRNELLLASPRVTDEVMIAAIRRDPEMNPWHLAQVLLANSPLTQRVLNVLTHSDVSPYYRELVLDGQNGGMTNTTLMEMELVHFGGEMESARADYIRQAFRQDSTGVLNDSIVYYLSDGASDAQLQTLLSYHLKRGQFQQADSLIALSPTMRWSQQFIDVVSVLYDALTDTAGADAIIAQNELLLWDVAVEDSREAYLAQSLLEIYELAEFDDIIVFPGEGPRSLMHQATDKISSEKPLASVHPNPAKNTVYLNWRLPEEINAENVHLLVYNAQGVQLYTERLNGPVGISEINISNWPSGLYIYQLQHEQIKLHSEKFEVLR